MSKMVASMQLALKGDPWPGSAGAAAAERPAAADRAAPRRPRASCASSCRRGCSGRFRQGNVEIGVDSRGLVVSIREAGSFPSGSAELSEGARALLADRSPRPLSELPHPMRIEGHTDDTPIRTLAVPLELGALDGARHAGDRLPAERSRTARGAPVGGRLRRVPSARAQRVPDGAGGEPPRRPRDPQQRDQQRRRAEPPPAPLALRRCEPRSQARRRDRAHAHRTSMPCASGSCRSIRPSAISTATPRGSRGGGRRAAGRPVRHLGDGADRLSGPRPAARARVHRPHPRRRRAAGARSRRRRRRCSSACRSSNPSRRRPAAVRTPPRCCAAARIEQRFRKSAAADLRRLRRGPLLRAGPRPAGARHRRPARSASASARTSGTTATSGAAAATIAIRSRSSIARRRRRRSSTCRRRRSRPASSAVREEMLGSMARKHGVPSSTSTRSAATTS